MKCSLCKKNEAVIYLQEQSSNGVRDINLCLECAAVEGLKIQPEQINGFFQNFLHNIFDSSVGTIAEEAAELLEITCPACGTTLGSITKHKKVGCINCFYEFEKAIDILLFQENNSLDYKGKSEDDKQSKKEYKIKMSYLKKQLRKVVKTEDFFTAAKIRDEIRTLEKGKDRGKND